MQSGGPIFTKCRTRNLVVFHPDPFSAKLRKNCFPSPNSPSYLLRSQWKWLPISQSLNFSGPNPSPLNPTPTDFPHPKTNMSPLPYCTLAPKTSTRAGITSLQSWSQTQALPGKIPFIANTFPLLGLGCSPQCLPSINRAQNSTLSTWEAEGSLVSWQIPGQTGCTW